MRPRVIELYRPAGVARPRGRAAHAEARPVALLELAQVTKHWSVSYHLVYKAANNGEIRRFARPGKQSYYALDEVLEAFGPPVVPLPEEVPIPDNHSYTFRLRVLPLAA